MSIIAVDWGTSSFRAKHITNEGEIIDSLTNNQGITQINAPFSLVLEQNISQLKGYQPTMPIIMSGMIGSKNGWYETIYTDLPCDAKSLSTHIKKLEDNIHQIYLIPGIAKKGLCPDVLRGEETEIIGAIQALKIKNATMIIPGTHSKVATITQSQLVDFKTFLTGEMFAALCKATILGSFGNLVDINSKWFIQGIEQGYHTQHAGELLNIIFFARSKILIGNLPSEYAASYLSGMLIGAEIGASNYTHQSIWIMGNGQLPLAYQVGLQHLGLTAKIVPENTIIQGYIAIAKLCGI